MHKSANSFVSSSVEYMPVFNIVSYFLTNNHSQHLIMQNHAITALQYE